MLKEVRKIIEHFQFALKYHSPTLCRRFCLLCRSSPTHFLRAILEMIRSRQPCFRCKGSVVLLIFRNGHAQNSLIFLFSVGTFSILSLRQRSILIVMLIGRGITKTGSKYCSLVSLRQKSKNNTHALVGHA